MKKAMIILLVAVLAVTGVFAGNTHFPRKGDVSLGVDLGNPVGISLRHQTGSDWSTYGGIGMISYPKLGVVGRAGIEYQFVDSTYFNREHKAWFYPTIGGEFQAGVLDFNNVSLWMAVLAPVAFNVQFREVPLELAITFAPGLGINVGKNRVYPNVVGFAFNAAATLRYRF